MATGSRPKEEFGKLNHIKKMIKSSLEGKKMESNVRKALVDDSLQNTFS